MILLILIIHFLNRNVILQDALLIRLQAMDYFEKRTQSFKYFFGEKRLAVSFLARVRAPISAVFKRLNRSADIQFTTIFLRIVLYSDLSACKSTAPAQFQSLDSSNLEKLHFLIPVFLKKTIALGRTSGVVKSDFMTLEVRPRAS